jgi:hypothetical protein
VPYGSEFTVTWAAEGWEEAFIILNRSRSGLTVESVVCNVGDQTEFKADSAFWGLSNASMGSDASRFIVGFRNVDRQISDSGLKVETLSRALWHFGIVE